MAAGGAAGLLAAAARVGAPRSRVHEGWLFEALDTRISTSDELDALEAAHAALRSPPEMVFGRNAVRILAPPPPSGDAPQHSGEGRFALRFCASDAFALLQPGADGVWGTREQLQLSALGGAGDDDGSSAEASSSSSSSSSSSAAAAAAAGAAAGGAPGASGSPAPVHGEPKKVVSHLTPHVAHASTWKKDKAEHVDATPVFDFDWTFSSHHYTGTLRYVTEPSPAAAAVLKAAESQRLPLQPAELTLDATLEKAQVAELGQVTLGGGGVQDLDDNDRAVRAAAAVTEERMDMVMLQRPDPILFFEEMTFFEDEVADSGSSSLTLRMRVMPGCFLLLLRFFLRIDSVLYRALDVRFFHKFGSDHVLRDVSAREAPADVVDVALRRAAAAQASPVTTTGPGARGGVRPAGAPGSSSGGGALGAGVGAARLPAFGGAAAAAGRAGGRTPVHPAVAAASGRGVVAPRATAVGGSAGARDDSTKDDDGSADDAPRGPRAHVDPNIAVPLIPIKTAFVERIPVHAPVS